MTNVSFELQVDVSHFINAFIYNVRLCDTWLISIIIGIVQDAENGWFAKLYN